MKFSKSIILALILILNLFVCPVVRTDDSDVVEENDDDGVINEEASTQTDEVQAQEPEEEADENLASSPFVTTHAFFVKAENLEFPPGKLVRLLASFHNNGTSDYIVDSIDASLRYPQDFSYYIQNFTAFEYNKVVESEHEATFEYAFTPSEAFSSRSFGLVVNVNYRNNEGKTFTNVLFNNTINVVEIDEGFDGETFFLYIFLVAIVVLLAVVFHHYFSSTIRKRVSSKPQSARVLPSGSNTGTDVDYEWIPKEHLQANKSPKTSPRQRRTGKQSSNGNQNSAGSASETDSK